MNLRTKKRRKIFLNLTLAFVILVSSAFIFPVRAYHIFLFFLYGNTVERVQPERVNLSEVLILDTREKPEFKVSQLKNAKWIGYSDFHPGRVKDYPKDTAILVYCSVGVRSERIGKQLIDAGFTNVKNLYGGIFEWKNNGFSVYRNAVTTDSVHIYGKGWGFFLRKGKGVL